MEAANVRIEEVALTTYSSEADAWGDKNKNDRTTLLRWFSPSMGFISGAIEN